MNEQRTPAEFLRVTEIFHSIQGESTWAGLPCTFVRLTGCPGLGQDNAAVLADFLGLDPDRVAELQDAGVIADRPPT